VKQQLVWPAFAAGLLAIVLSRWSSSPVVAMGRSGPPPHRSVTLDFVGDVMLGGGVAELIRSGGPGAPFASVAGTLARSDGVVGNLECALSSRGTPTLAKPPAQVRAHKEWLLRGPPSAARGLKTAGFAAVSVANNHTMDYGSLALADTLDALASNGVAWSGAGPDVAAAWRPALFARGGTRFALLAVTDIIPLGFAAGVHHPGVAAGRSLVTGTVDEAALARMGAAIKSARRVADVVIVYEHWGTEGVAAPSAEQRMAAHAAIDDGATVVFGSHPHVLGPLEAYHGGLIAYGLGNFVFDTYPGPGARSEILEVEFHPNGALESWTSIPATIVDGSPTVTERGAK
jgi:poly-gamma-glutamate capsule biosynthesis protein CapA/YwtB (metallophosphatase superfamily)